MISFVLSLVILILGYVFYGRLVERVFAPDDRKTPAVAREDGVDFVPLKLWKLYLVQLLNIAGTGPIFGALMGACFGPVVFLWIIFGAIIGGGVHDYMCGMISERHDGASIAELSGVYLGPLALIYYLLAAIWPIDKIIGRVYPVFGGVLIIMAVGIVFGIIRGGYTVPELTLQNLHPKDLPVWPFMFVTVACGAISGFHSTQSPMVAKCITSEKQGRKVFYGAMLSESVIALVWAAGGVAFYGTTGGLQNALTELGQSGTVYNISTGMLGTVGGILAVIGVVVCPITSGDTAFRSARLILAETTKLDQKSIRNRIILTVPMLVFGAVMTQIDFNVLWRYFSWSNQSLAMIALWVSTEYLIKTHKNPFASLITAVPASFMTGVCLTYILMAEEGFRIPGYTAYPIGIGFAVSHFIFFILLIKCRDKVHPHLPKLHSESKEL